MKKSLLPAAERPEFHAWYFCSGVTEAKSHRWHVWDWDWKQNRPTYNFPGFPWALWIVKNGPSVYKCAEQPFASLDLTGRKKVWEWDTFIVGRLKIYLQLTTSHAIGKKKLNKQFKLIFYQICSPQFSFEKDGAFNKSARKKPLRVNSVIKCIDAW